MKTHVAFLFCLLPVSFVTGAADPVPAPKPSAPDPVGLLLIKSCEEGNDNEMVVLIGEGASITAVDAEGSTPLMKAAGGAHPILVKKLLAAKAPVDTVNQYGETALNLAAWQGDADSVGQLLEAGARANTMSKNGSTPLMGAASRGDNAIAGALLQHGAEVNAVSKQGTPLTEAAQNQKLATLKLLLDHGADPNLVPTPGTADESALTALNYAGRAGSVEETDLLLAHGAKVDLAILGFTPMMAAAQVNHVDVMQRLKVHDPQLDLQDGEGNSALINAARWGCPDAARQLIDWKANLDLKDNQGRTALISAAQKGEAAIATLLCQKGADVNVRDTQGRTAMDYAMNRGLVDAVAALQARGVAPVESRVIVATTSAPLPAPRAWGLAMAALYLQLDGDNLAGLLTHGYPDTDDSKSMLKNSWSVTDHDTLLAELHDLATTGYRQDFATRGAQLVKMDDADWHAYLDKYPKKQATITAARASYEKWKDRTGLAFDLCRYINLVDRGYAAGYLGEEEAWDLIMPMAKKAQESFGSWQEMSDNFLDGREIWNNGRDPQFDALAKLLLNPHDENSPWTHNVWSTDLGTKADTDDQVSN
jgi:ankyrin repeat protein